MQTSSWVVREKDTGKVMLETFNPAIVRVINSSRYEAIPIGQYLASLNKQGSVPCREVASAA